MKKTFYIILCLLSILLGACTQEQADIFDMSAAQRLSKAMNDGKDTLQSAHNGWVMEYFATPESPGYTMLIKFNTSGQAIIAGKSELTNNVLLTDSCLYKMIGDNGPVLTFDTFNKVLHAFSNPINPDGFGLEGDYEFVIISKTANEITLKGKKRGAIIKMTKVPNDITWQQYFANLDAMNSTLFGGKPPKLTMYFGNLRYWFSNGTTHIFDIIKSTASQSTIINSPFIVTPTGIRFYSTQTIEGKNFQTLTLSANKSTLVSVESPEISLVGTEIIAEYFIDEAKQWIISPTELSPKVKAVYDKIVLSCKTKYKGDNMILSIIYHSTRKCFVFKITFNSGKTKYEGNADLTLNMAAKSELAIIYKGTCDNNFAKFYPETTGMNGMKEMIELISSNFVLTSQTLINPQNIKLVQKLNADAWLNVSCQ